MANGKAAEDIAFRLDPRPAAPAGVTVGATGPVPVVGPGVPLPATGAGTAAPGLLGGPVAPAAAPAGPSLMSYLVPAAMGFYGAYSGNNALMAQGFNMSNQLAAQERQAQADRLAAIEAQRQKAIDQAAEAQAAQDRARLWGNLDTTDPAALIDRATLANQEGNEDVAEDMFKLAEIRQKSIDADIQRATSNKAEAAALAKEQRQRQSRAIQPAWDHAREVTMRANDLYERVKQETGGTFDMEQISETTAMQVAANYLRSVSNEAITQGDLENYMRQPGGLQSLMRLASASLGMPLTVMLEYPREAIARMFNATLAMSESRVNFVAKLGAGLDLGHPDLSGLQAWRDTIPAEGGGFSSRVKVPKAARVISQPGRGQVKSNIPRILEPPTIRYPNQEGRPPRYRAPGLLGQ